MYGGESKRERRVWRVANTGCNLASEVCKARGVYQTWLQTSSYNTRLKLGGTSYQNLHVYVELNYSHRTNTFSTHCFSQIDIYFKYKFMS